MVKRTKPQRAIPKLPREPRVRGRPRLGSSLPAMGVHRVNPLGTVSIPFEMRDSLGLKGGGYVHIRMRGRSVILTPVELEWKLKR